MIESEQKTNNSERDSNNRISKLQYDRRLVEYFFVLSPQIRQSQAVQMNDAGDDFPMADDKKQIESAPLEMEKMNSSAIFDSLLENEDYEENFDEAFSRLNLIGFDPKINARFPLQDYSENPLTDMVTSFCYPTGDMKLTTKFLCLISISVSDLNICLI